MINELFADVKTRMEKAIDHYHSEILGIRTGRASANILDIVKVDYYGTPTPVRNMAQISIPEAQQIVILPYDKNTLKNIEKAIIASDLGLAPNNDGSMIRLKIPALTDERREELIRMAHKIIEEGRVAIRNIRRDANEQLKKFNKESSFSEDNLKRATDDIQEMTDKSIEELNKLQEKKETEIRE